MKNLAMLFSLFGIFIAPLNAKAQDTTSQTHYTFNSPPNTDCALKKFDSGQNAWVIGNASDIGSSTFIIEKEYANIGGVGFKINGQWFSAKKICLQTPTEKWNAFKPMTFSLGYRKTSLTLTNGTNSYALGEKWVGIIFGTQRDRKISSSLAFRWGGDLEAGISTVEQDSTVTAIAYKNSGVSTFGARGLIGLASRATNKIILNVETGLLLKYGKYLVPSGYSSITSFHTNMIAGVGIENRFNLRSGLKFEGGFVGTTKQLFFEGGFEINVP